MSSATYDHQMSVEMEEWFFGDVAKDEDGQPLYQDLTPESFEAGARKLFERSADACPACGERWHECQCPVYDPFSDEEV